ncbi:hypothetical protein XELAEV_18026159mg [Xenopus laevis]|uniref:tRNA (32-2'-O)-methyltransferase regulator THADA n=1 Tax=Xenopus laevis TaxID=8355 RepID=A0A974CV49_XENLA|nr:hypothetical protein XELAEV_18026159mg [Xenopus laevis]
MVLKKKKELKVDVLVFDGPSIQKLQCFADEKEQNVPSLLLHCVQLQDGVQQIHCIKQIVPLLGSLPADSSSASMVCACLDVLSEMYFSLNSKNPLKKVLASSLNSIPDQYKADAVGAFTRCLGEDIATEDPEKYRKVVDDLASCMDNFSLGTSSVASRFLEALQFLERVLRMFQSQNKRILGNGLAQTQLMHDLLTAVKLSMMLVQKVQDPIQAALLQSGSPDPLWRTLCDLLGRFADLMMDEDLLQNVQSTSGMAVILYMKLMLHDPDKLPTLVSNVILCTVDSGDAPDWFLSCCKSFCKDPPDTVLLFLCQGALAMLEWKDGSMGEGGEKLLLDLLDVLLSQSSRLNESSVAMLLSRVLALWTGSALDLLTNCSTGLKDKLNGHSSATCKLLEYVYVHWEHPLDAVRHQTKLIFRNLLQMHRKAVELSDEDLFLSELTHSLLHLEWHSKGKYAALACLVECVGAEQILAVDDTMPSQILNVMGDQSFAPYASNLLEAMFINHKNQLTSRSGDQGWTERWHDIWVSPLLLRLCEENINQTTYIIDYYLPKVLKCNPESLNFMIEVLQASASTNLGSGSSRGALGALMACLRTARAHGHLRFTENYVWSGKVSTALIQQGLVHRHDQVRVDALGLLCESHWSTEVVSLDEMKLVLFCLKYNLNCQSPSIRQQLCYLFKKEFMASVTNCLFESLFAGSSHPTRFSALTILGAVAEIFPVEEEVSCQRVFQLGPEVQREQVQALLECLSNTFEEVKALAFDLLRKLTPCVLALKETDKLLPLLQAAMSLSTSTKHFDCVTASYLLNFLMCQEALPVALDALDQNQTGPVMCPSRNTEHVSFVERNTFSAVRYLMNRLSEEILQAEKSLLQAAGSFPLYGRVHCIIALLQQLPLKELSLVAEWRDVIGRLILMSYRLSAIVSPVVHSSSPEGLMPMDTDTEAASQLHMIMSEIQPRDTNDYFSQPRTLQKQLHSQPLPEDSVPANSLCAEMRGSEGTSCSVTAQMVLVCCWRSMKEVSLLLGMFCQDLPLLTGPESPHGLITMDQVKEMGEYFKHHLLQSRHRGAFELAYVGFAKLTEMLIGCKEESLHRLPGQWLCNVLEEIKSSDPSSKLCATRRSAGIPFYIQALLASEPKNSKGGLLKMTMKQLISLAMPESDASGNKGTIPQVHALNILRALFRDTRLGENVIPYVADGTQAAILGFTSPVWAVRNSSTLLFSTLITRIFGVKRGKDERSKKNRMTGREFFSRFPALYPFLLEHLEVVANTVDSSTGESKLHPSLFLLLLILSKLYPSPMDGTYSALSMAPFIPFIIRCGHSPVYRSREMAAHALVPFVMTNEVPQTALTLLNSLPDSSDPCVRQNRVHGTLLQVFYLLQSFFEAKHSANSERIQREMGDIMACMKARLWLAKSQNPCLVTRASFINILEMILNNQEILRNKEFSSFYNDICTIIESDMSEDVPNTSAIPGQVQYVQSMTRLVLSALTVKAKLVRPDTGPSDAGNLECPARLLERLLRSDFPEVRLLVLESLSKWSDAFAEETRDYLTSEAEKTLFEMISLEKNTECLCQVLTLYYKMGAEELLLKVNQHFQAEPKELLTRILKLASTTSHSVEIQSSALRLSSELLGALVAKAQEDIGSELKEWTALVVQCCEDELQTEVKLAAAEMLIKTAPSFLTNQVLVLGLANTLSLWTGILQLLQSEDPSVRDAAADIIRVYHAQQSQKSDTAFPFCTVNPPMALDLALQALCALIQQWDQVPAGIPILLQWLLGDDDLSDLETIRLVEEDFLFEKGEANFWAEKLIFVRLLSKHLGELITSAPLSLPSKEKLSELSRAATERSETIQGFLHDLPSTPEFLKTTEYTRLLIEKERTSRCIQLLALLHEQTHQECV